MSDEFVIGRFGQTPSGCLCLPPDFTRLSLAQTIIDRFNNFGQEEKRDFIQEMIGSGNLSLVDVQIGDDGKIKLFIITRE